MHNIDGGIYGALGVEAYVAISRTFISKRSEPYSNCISDLEPFSDYSARLFGYFNDLNATQYDQELCIKLCFQDKLIERCSCASLVVKTMNGTQYCETDTEIQCEKEFDNLFSFSDPDLFCEDVCKEECESQKFGYTISFSKFPTQRNTVSHANKTVLLRFIVNYKEITCTQILESPAITFEKFLGELGGQIHLFLGLSFLSLFEFFELLVETIVLYFNVVEQYVK
jgi:hypothetical protein